MKYTIEGFNQKKAIEFGLTVEHLLILRWFIDFSPRMTEKIIDGESYKWVNYKALLEDMPILKFSSKDRLYRKFKDMVDKKILKNKTVKNLDGSFSYYTCGEEYLDLIAPVENNEPRPLKITDHNNSSTIKTNNICSSHDERDSSLADNFDKIWAIYPRKDGKNTAFKHYKAWLVGKQYAGRTIKLDNKQMWLAVKRYSDIIEKNNTDKQYIKMGSTFFNEAIMEFVEDKI